MAQSTYFFGPHWSIHSWNGDQVSDIVWPLKMCWEYHILCNGFIGSNRAQTLEPQERMWEVTRLWEWAVGAGCVVWGTESGKASTLFLAQLAILFQANQRPLAEPLGFVIIELELITHHGSGGRCSVLTLHTHLIFIYQIYWDTVYIPYNLLI